MAKQIFLLFFALLAMSTTAKSQTTETFTVNGVSFTMVAVDGGTFTMGATREQADDALDEEKPAHKVTLSSFSIGQTEVTQELWQAVMGENPSYYNGTGNRTMKYMSFHDKDYGANLKRPVEYVSWDDCQEFIVRLNALTGKNFRLPTEAEWEYAARGGAKSRGYKYSGSNNIDEVAWYEENTYKKGKDSPENCTHAVGTKSPNELGLYDMSGNVEEWCADYIGDYSKKSQTNPKGPSSGTYRVFRGGNHLSMATECRVSYRNGAESDQRIYRGLRLAM